MDEVTAAARDLVQSLDGTMGRTWSEVADEVAEQEYPASVSTAELVALIRALVAVGELRD